MNHNDLLLIIRRELNTRYNNLRVESFYDKLTVYVAKSRLDGRRSDVWSHIFLVRLEDDKISYCLTDIAQRLDQWWVDADIADPASFETLYHLIELAGGILTPPGELQHDKLDE